MDQAYLTTIGFNSIERSWLFAIVNIIISTLIVYLAHAKWFGKKYVFLSLPILMVLGFLPAYWLPKIGAIFCYTLVQIVGVARFSLLDQYTNEEFNSKYRATALSALNMLVSLVFVFLALSGGKLISLIGTAGTMSALGVLSLLLVVPSSILLVRKISV